MAPLPDMGRRGLVFGIKRTFIVVSDIVQNERCEFPSSTACDHPAKGLAIPLRIPYSGKMF